MTTPTLLVPDLSEWQKDVDWPKLVGAGYPAVILRAYNGARADHTFAANREHGHAAGARLLGLYAYLETAPDVEDQAAGFVHTVGALRAGEWPIVDCETGTDAAARVRAWAAHVARALGYETPWLYSGESFYNSQHLSGAGVAVTRTWLAAYGSHEPREPHALWQYTDHRTVPGVAGVVDCSTFHGTVDQLAALVEPKAKPPARPPVHPTPGPTAHASHPFPVGIHPGGTHPSARPLQAALKLTRWLSPNVVESDHYGPLTQAAVAGFNAKHGMNTRGVEHDVAIGPHGWALLMSLAYGKS